MTATEKHGFRLIQSQYITEIATQVNHYRHIRTGAELISCENSDDNKSFGIAFHTPPPDDTGLPHILEHSVLCGSRLYPVKDPFVQLAKTSLNSFLNAITFPDMTIYPIASPNLQDFYNLIDVYLDAAFYPLITPQTFMQEGWHFETEGPDQPLTLRGVVFNEMKGYASTPDFVLQEKQLATVLPDTPYARDSGGNPAVMPQLTYEQFKHFHETYYHPSNARFFFYGDDDASDRLRRIDAFLVDFEAIEVKEVVSTQPRWSEPRQLVVPYDAGEADAETNKGYITLTWLLPEVTQQKEILALAILSHILIDTPASPLRNALLESELGEDLAGGGLDLYKREATFSTGLKGIRVEDAPKVEALVLETLAQLAEEGLDPATVEAAFNTIEFELREKNTGRFPRGLMAMISILPAWIHGGNPIEALRFEEGLNQLRERWQAEPGYLHEMIGQYFIDNPHRVTITLIPDPTVKAEREEAEARWLAEQRASMNDQDIARIMQVAQELQALQNAEDDPADLAKIPTLTLKDIDPKTQTTPTALLNEEGTPIYFHDIATSGIAYLDLGFNLGVVPGELIPYFGIFGTALLEMGTAEEDHIQLAQRIGAKTGGIDDQIFISSHLDQPEPVAYFFLRGKATTGRVDDLLGILHDILLTARLDNRERFRQIVLEAKAEREAYLGLTGHVNGNHRLRAHFDTAGWLDEQINGVTQLIFLRQLAERINHNWDGVLADLEAIRTALLHRQSLIVNATVDEAPWSSGIHEAVRAFLAELPSRDVPEATWSRTTYPDFEGFTVPTQINFVTKGANLYELGYRLHGASQVIFKHVNLTYLWNRIRVQGGAYGGACFFNPISGVATYLSWQDPNITQTLKAYDETADYLRQINMSADDLEKAIIGAIGTLDAYLLPDAKGFQATTRLLIGFTDDRRQNFRDEVLHTSLADFRTLADVLEQAAQVGKVVITGSPDALTKANAELGNLLAITPLA